MGGISVFFSLLGGGKGAAWICIVLLCAWGDRRMGGWEDGSGVGWVVVV